MCFCCLSKQSKRHLDTIVWRSKTNIKRDKGSLLYVILYPLAFLGMAIGLGGALNSGLGDQTFNAIVNDNYSVTAQAFTANTGDISFASDPDSLLTTTQDFKQCRLARSTNIGIFKSNTGDSAADTEANAILRSIYTEINTAFQHAVPDSEELNMVEFDSQGELDDYVLSKEYQTNALCFTMQWNKYVMDETSPQFNLEILTNYKQSNMTDPNIPQDRYYTTEFSSDSIFSYQDTDYLQVMALATQHVTSTW